MAERGRGKTTGPPTTAPRGGPRPATPLTTTFGFESSTPTQTQRNYEPPPTEEPSGIDQDPQEEDQDDGEDDEPSHPGPSRTTEEKDIPPGSTKIRHGVYEIGLSRYIDSSIPTLVRDEARELRRSYLQTRITTEGLTKRDRKILLLDTTETLQEQLAIMQELVGELTAFGALEQAYEGIQKQRGYHVDLYRISQRPSQANSQVQTPATSRPSSPPYIRVGSPTVLSTFQPGRGGGGNPSGGQATQTTQPRSTNIARFQLGTWSDPLQRFNISLHAGDGPTNSPKVAKPEKYDGLKKGSEAERFIDQTENYFHFKAHEFRSDTDCVAWTMQYLTGNAYNWFAPYWKKRNNILARPEEITRWAAFRKTFFITFGEYHQKEKAEEKIKQLKQRADASRYTSDFNNLRSMINWNLEALKSHYIQGLKPDVIKFASTQPWPDSLEGIQEQAIRIDDVLFQAKNREREAPTPIRNPRPSPAPTYNRPFQPKPTTPFTPRTTSTQKATPRGKLTQAERDERKKLGLCNYCGKAGHFAQQCPNAPKRLEARAAELTPNDDESTIETFESTGNSQSQ